MTVGPTPRRTVFTGREPVQIEGVRLPDSFGFGARSIVGATTPT